METVVARQGLSIIFQMPGSFARQIGFRAASGKLIVKIC